ncbi:hypothetical protein GCM10027037_26480 [Mucilaginibacter koreensis]
MATLKTIAPATWTTGHEHIESFSFNHLWTKFTNFADSQKGAQAVWFFLILLVHGVFFLPLPAVLMYYFDAPIMVLAVTMVTFFANLICTMGGAGMRTALLFFMASIVIHLLMAAIVIL